jgi:hypothetical protein
MRGPWGFDTELRREAQSFTENGMMFFILCETLCGSVSPCV